VLGCGQIRATTADKVQEVGIGTACKFLRVRVEAQYTVPGQLIEKANNLLNWASGDGVTQTQLANTMLQLYLSRECRRGHDITVDFLATVVEAMSKELQVTMPEEQYRTDLQRYRELLNEAQKEVTRRRGALGPVTFVRSARLHPPDITGEAKRFALGKVFEQEQITRIVEEWLHRSLQDENKQFLVAEPVLKQTDRKVLWDRVAGVIMNVQHLCQLSKGEIFNIKDDWREAQAQSMVQETVFKVTVSVLSNDQRAAKSSAGGWHNNQRSAPTPIGGQCGNGGRNPKPGEAAGGSLGTEAHRRRRRQSAASEFHSAGPDAGHPHERIATVVSCSALPHSQLLQACGGLGSAMRGRASGVDAAPESR
jgi:hypothetical protein